MTHSDPSNERPRGRWLRVSTDPWELLVFMAGATPWLALAVLTFST